MVKCFFIRPPERGTKGGGGWHGSTHPELFATRLVVGGCTGTIMRKCERLRDREFIHAPFACNVILLCTAEWWVLPLGTPTGEKLESPLSCFSSKLAFFVSPGIWLAMLDPNLCFHCPSKNKAQFNLRISILVQGNWSRGAVSNKAETG